MYYIKKYNIFFFICTYGFNFDIVRGTPKSESAIMRKRNSKKIILLEYLLFLAIGILIGKYLPLLNPSKYTEGRANAYADHDALLSGVEEPLHVIDNVQIKDVTLIPQAYEIMGSINLRRKSEGLDVLKTNAYLNCAAQVHARTMMSEKECKHAFEGEPNLRMRTLRCGIGSLTGTEVISCDEPFGDMVLQNWMRTEANYKTLMNPEYRQIGCDTLAKNWVCILTK
jgi:hypothetical protein